ncbi:helicase [Phenylobacterium sp. J367]|uniref:helicase n=1 Tax=Phenylobacterium sp. J367 TaxID=2898435 RepID=UPI0021519715|nr:helicase [Phenylobacterium sp. J367]MCR5877590.1 helicase [Phenylobacterium sp. J367]
MGSRRQAEGEGARLPALSRRAVIAGTSAAVLPAPKLAASPVAAATISEGAKPYRRWLYVNAKIERLQTRWAKLETWLVREHSWFQLSLAEQQALPWARELRDIDGCLDVLFEQREALLETLPTHGSTTLEAVAAKLEVIERLVERDDHPEAHAMIAGARQDLVAWLHRRRQPTA